MSMLGGFSDPKPADEEVKKITAEVKPVVEAKTGFDCTIFTAMEYREQVVKGMNYLVKVHLGADCCFHLLIFQQPCYGGKVELKKIKMGMKLENPLVPFERD